MPEISPEEIRAIRQSLGLTQAEAGEILGGGPRAFTKYEAGTVKPAASVVNLLRLLEAKPAAIATLGGRVPQPINASMVGPFEVTSDHITVFRERDLPVLLRKLLSAESQANDLPPPRICVPSNIHAPDGGEDGRITWMDGPEHTRFLPSRLNQFQLKSGKLSPEAAARDILTKQRKVKGMVSSVIGDGGHYIMLCSNPYNGKEITEREARIRKALRDAGLTIRDEQVQFRDADQIASWANSLPSVAMWVKEQTQPGVIGPFRSWARWAGRDEHHRSPWLEDERLPGLRDRIQEVAAAPQRVIRIVGLSGVGKSRLVLKALEDAGREDTAGPCASDLVMYAVESETGHESITGSVQRLADASERAVVVVDDCRPETHRALAGMALSQGSRLSLITIDNEIPMGTPDGDTLEVVEAPPSVTEGIINHISPGLPHEDRYRLELFSKGFPEVAARVGRTWNESRPIAHATDDEFVGTFVLGRNPIDPTLLLKSAMLLAVFGIVEAESATDGHLNEVASLGRGLSADDLYAATAQLADRGVAQRRGRLISLQPRPVAMKLAERQWRDWGPEKWDEVLGGNTSRDLKMRAARQLALLNTTELARTVAARVCRPSGPFGGIQKATRPGHPEVLSSLAEIDTLPVANLIERLLDEAGDLYPIQGNLRRQTVSTLEKIASHPDTFEVGARLLLRLAVAENERWGNNATEQFKALFPMFLGNTAADGNARLSVLDEATRSQNHGQRAVVIEALHKGAEAHNFFRLGNPGAHGSRPSLEYWHPSTEEEKQHYVEGCVTRLAEFSKEDDDLASLARTRLGHHLRLLALHGFIDVVENVIEEVRPTIAYWPEALESLGDFIKYDTGEANPDVAQRVKSLVTQLKPQSLEARLRLVVTEMPWDYPCDRELDLETLNQLQLQEIRSLAEELLKTPEILAGFLPELIRVHPRTAQGRVPQRRTFDFGSAVAELSDSPLDWLEPIIHTLLEIQEQERDLELLSGYVSGISMTCPEQASPLKQLLVSRPELAPAFPQMCLKLGIAESDVRMAINATQSGVLHPKDLDLWRVGGQLSKVSNEVLAPLLDTMLSQGNGSYSVALSLMSAYVFRDQDRLEHLRPQIRQVLGNATQENMNMDHSGTSRRLIDILTWILSKGREDEDARAVALELAKRVTSTRDFDKVCIFAPLVPTLLSDFPEVTWPLIGQVILNDAFQKFRLVVQLY